MNELINDIKSLEIETLKNLKNSKAKNTLRAYQADFKDFSSSNFASSSSEIDDLIVYLGIFPKTFKHYLIRAVAKLGGYLP